MNRGLLWRLVIGVVMGAVIVFSVLHHMASKVITQMNKLDQVNQTRLQSYATETEHLMAKGSVDEVRDVLAKIDQNHGVWSAVIDNNNQIISHRDIPENLRPFLGFQRKLHWPVHAFIENTLVGIPINQGKDSFVIELPRSMYPQVNEYYMRLLMTVVLPVFFLLGFCLLLYRYMMRPLHALKDTAVKLAGRDLNARVIPDILQKNDEFAVVGQSFNTMAQRLQELVVSQQQMLGNLSHEMRTPITRLELALDLAREDELSNQELISRLEKDIGVMNHLVEDSLNLAWLESNPEIPSHESFGLSMLLHSICEDAAFEFPQHQIICDFQDDFYINDSNQKVISHSVENILRNALHYSPEGSGITVSCRKGDSYQYVISVTDQGSGVAESELEDIFKPFYRADKHRANRKGFGLGLAIARRQLEAIGGTIRARNTQHGGLEVVIELR